MKSSRKSLHYWNTRAHTHSSTDSFSGLVYSYLSNYSSFPRAPAKGLLANMLMKTNGGNLSVLRMSLGSGEKELERHRKTDSDT